MRWKIAIKLLYLFAILFIAAQKDSEELELIDSELPAQSIETNLG